MISCPIFFILTDEILNSNYINPPIIGVLLFLSVCSLLFVDRKKFVIGLVIWGIYITVTGSSEIGYGGLAIIACFGLDQYTMPS
jgi:hypothetical protein